MVQDDNVSRYAFISVSDGTYFAFQSSKGIEVMITDPYHDSSLYRSKKDFLFEHDENRARQINEHFEQNN